MKFIRTKYGWNAKKNLHFIGIFMSSIFRVTLYTSCSIPNQTLQGENGNGGPSVGPLQITCSFLLKAEQRTMYGPDNQSMLTKAVPRMNSKTVGPLLIQKNLIFEIALMFKNHECPILFFLLGTFILICTSTDNFINVSNFQNI